MKKKFLAKLLTGMFVFFAVGRADATIVRYTIADNSSVTLVSIADPNEQFEVDFNGYILLDDIPTYGGSVIAYYDILDFNFTYGTYFFEGTEGQLGFNTVHDFLFLTGVYNGTGDLHTWFLDNDTPSMIEYSPEIFSLPVTISMDYWGNRDCDVDGYNIGSFSEFTLEQSPVPVPVPVPVPEPETIFLLGIGLAGFVNNMVRRKKRKQ